MFVCVITGMYPTPIYPYGGTFVTQRISALKELGCEVDAYTLVVKETWLMRRLRLLLGRRPNEEVQETIPTKYSSVCYKTIKVPMNTLEFIINTLLKERYFIRKALPLITQSIGQNRYDVIHGHWLYPTGGAVVRYAQSVDTPCVITAHGSEVHRDMRKKYREGCLWTLEHCTKAEFVSHALLNIAKQYGYSGKNAHVLPNGIHPQPLNHINKDGRTIGFVGSLLPIKRADAFPTIFRNILQQIPDSHFVLIGEGALRTTLEDQLSNLPVQFMGQISHDLVLQNMMRMDVILIPSRNEGWPCVVLEAQSCGTPVVGSSNGGIPEAIGDERLIVTESDHFESDFAQRVVDVLLGKIPINPAALIDRAQQYTWNHLQQTELSLYRRLR